MKRLLLLPVLMTLVLVSVPLRAQDSDFRPDYGMLNGRRYVNGYFGFSYRFPEGWTGTALRSPALGESKMYPLFAANPQEASTSDLRYLSINADYIAPNTTVKTPKDFLEVSVNAQTGSGGPFEVLSQRSDKQRPVMYGGKQFSRADMRSRPAPGNPVFYQTQICILLKSYAITFSFMAANSDDMDDLVRTMESLTFSEPGLLANAPSRPPSIQPQPQSEPAVVATVTTEPAPAATPAQAPSAVLPAGTTQNRATETSRTAPARTPSRKAGTVDVSGSASEVPTAEIPTTTVPSRTPEPVTVQPAAPVTAEGGMVASAQPTSLPATTTPEPQRTSPAVSPATHQSAPSTVIQNTRTPSRTTYETQATTPRTQVPSTVINQPATPPAAVSAPPRAEPTPKPAATPAPTPTPTYVASGTSNPPPVTQPAAEIPKAEPVPTPAPTVMAMNASPPIGSPSAGGAPMRVHVSATVLDEYVTHKIQPSYPLIARTAGVEGMVVLDIVVDSKGAIKDVKVLNGPALLVRGAEDAVRQWRFKPYIVDGAAVEMESQISMNFRLR